MKANRKFIHGDDKAVSPVIAVILMVAITVVLAATVYVWVSGFGQSSSSPAKSISLTTAGSEECQTDTVTYPACTDDAFEKTYTVASASTGLTYDQMSMVIDGAAYKFVFGTPAEGDPMATPAEPDQWGAAAGSTPKSKDSPVRAGDVITFVSTASQVGKTLQILDPNANSIMLTLTIAS